MSPVEALGDPIGSLERDRMGGEYALRVNGEPGSRITDVDRYETTLFHDWSSVR